jgi:hypothetical protein
MACEDGLPANIVPRGACRTAATQLKDPAKNRHVDVDHVEAAAASSHTTSFGVAKVLQSPLLSLSFSIDLVQV